MPRIFVIISLLLISTTVWASKQVEAEFLQRMSEHHQEAIVMSQLALKKSKDDKIKKLAEKIISDQSDEQKQMKEVKEKSYSNIPLPPKDTHMTDISSLEKADGKEFDKNYLQLMSKHHKSGIEMMGKLLPNIDKRNIHRMAIKMAKKQGREIARMEKIQAAL